MNKIKFVLDGCDISFIAEAPKDITLEQLLKQCDKIEPNWCACGIKSIDKYNEDFAEEYKNIPPTEIVIDYNSIKKVDDDVHCKIKESE